MAGPTGRPVEPRAVAGPAALAASGPDARKTGDGTALPLRRRIGRFGVRGVVLAWLLRKLESRLGLHVWVFGIRAISPTWRLPAAHAAAFDFRLLRRDEALAAAEDPALRLDGDFVATAFRRGDLCCGAFAGGRLIGYTWLSFVGASGPHGIRLHLQSRRVVYGYKTFVHPDFRGQRLNTSLVRFAEPALARRGVEFEIGYVALANLASMRAYFGSGECRRLGRALLIDWPGLFRVVCRSRVGAVVRLERDGDRRPVRQLA